jgi:YVTN family beta-propeller protein
MNKSHLVPIRLSLLSSSLKNSFFRGASMALATALAALTLAAPASAWDRPNIITATIPTSASTVQLVLDPVRHKVYAGTEVYQGVDTVSNVNTVQVIDEKTHAVIQKITVPVEANSLAIDPIHGKVYVSSQYSGVVYVIDESTDTLVDSITVVSGVNYT